MRSICLILLFSLKAFGAIAGTAVWEVRPTNGNDSNGGCFDVTKAGTDFSQQNAVQYNFTDLASTNGTSSSPSVTSVSHSFVTADIGNCLHISAGTNWTTGWYEISSVAAGAATLDRAVGSTATLSAGTWFEGGALKTLTQLNSNMQQCNSAYTKAESTISISSTITFNFSNANDCLPFVAGYSSARGDQGQVTISESTGLQPMVNLNSGGLQLQNFILNCNSQTNSYGLEFSTWNGGQNILVENCQQTNSTNQDGIYFNGNAYCYNCVVENSSNTSGDAQSAAFYSSNTFVCVYCVATGNTNMNGFFQNNTNSVWVCDHCIAANNTGATWDGFQTATGNQLSMTMVSCVAYKNGRDGFRLISAGGGNYTVLNSISYGNGAFGLNMTTLGNSAYYVAARSNLNFNAYGSNTSGNLNVVTAGANDVTLSADPFVNGASNNFALASGGITALGGNGFPGALQVGGTGHLDIGALQHQASGGGQRGFPIVQ